MKNRILTLLMLTSMLAVAQPTGRPGDFEEKREKIEAIKVAFITEQIDLSVEESQSFWPVYNEMSNKEHALRKAQRDAFGGLKDFENASDKEVEKAIMELADLSVEIEELRKSYLPKFVHVDVAASSPWLHPCFRIPEPTGILYLALQFDHSKSQH